MFNQTQLTQHPFIFLICEASNRHREHKSFKRLASEYLNVIVPSSLQ